MNDERGDARTSSSSPPSPPPQPPGTSTFAFAQLAAAALMTNEKREQKIPLLAYQNRPIITTIAATVENSCASRSFHNSQSKSPPIGRQAFSENANHENQRGERIAGSCIIRLFATCRRSAAAATAACTPLKVKKRRQEKKRRVHARLHRGGRMRALELFDELERLASVRRSRTLGFHVCF